MVVKGVTPMQRRDVSGMLLGAAALSALLPDEAKAQTCTPPCFPQTTPESAAGLTPTNLSKFPSPWKDISRFVPDNQGNNDYSAQLTAAFAAEKNIIIP